MDEKIVKKIMEIERDKYQNIKLDIYSIEQKFNKYYITISINILNIGINIINIDITDEEYELEWIEYKINKLINDKIRNFYFKENE